MTDTSPAPDLPRTRPEWLAEVRAWIAQSLEELGASLTGPVEQVLARSWSTILRVPSSLGSLYFKASIPLLAGEPALSAALHRWRPDCTLPVLAGDYTRGWMLMPDGGPMLRASLHSEADLIHAAPLMPLMAGLQIDLIPHQSELLELAPFDRRLERLPEMFETLLEDRSAYLIDTADGLTSEQYRRLRAGPALPGAVRPAGSLQHPFFSMLICLRALSDRAGYPGEAADAPEALYPALARLRDLYLEPWERFEPHDRLVEAFNLAWRAGMVNRAITWHAVIAAVEPPFRAQLACAVPGWMNEFLALMERMNL